MKCPHCGKHYASNRAVVVEYGGEPMSLRELAFAVGLPPSTLIQRYQRGHRGDALVKPAGRNGRKQIGGSLLKSELGVSRGTGSPEVQRRACWADQNGQADRQDTEASP